MNALILDEAITLYNSRKYGAALAKLETLDIEEDPRICYYRGLCCAQLEKYDEALLYLEQVVTRHSNILLIYQSRMILSYIYCVTGRYRLAEFEVNKLLSSGFDSPQVHAAAAYVHFMSGRIDESLASLEQALKLDPENANALNSLGYILAEKNRDLSRAVACCQAAVKKYPNNYAYLDSLGWAYFKSGDHAGARECLRKALSLARSNKVIAQHMREVVNSQKH